MDMSEPKGRRALFAILAAVLAFAPLVVYPTFLMKFMCFALFACAYNLVAGYGGLLSFGHAIFFGGAAYVYAYLVKHGQWALEPAVLVAVLAGAVLGLIVGMVAIRRQGIYVGMVTLALAQMFYFLCVQLPGTGGEDGIQGIPRPDLFGRISIARDEVFYYVVLLVFLAGFAAVWRIVRSPFGEMLTAIRDNQPRAVSLGCEVGRYKLLAFVLSAALSACAGAMFTATMGFASLNGVHWHLSGEVIMMALIGGMGTMFGPVVGAAIVLVMQTYLAGIGQWVLVAQGMLFIVVVLFFRNGLMGTLLARLNRAGTR